MELAGYLFALFYLFHFLIGIFVLGFIFGKITQKRFASKKLIHSLWLAVFTFVVIFIIGGLDGIFSQMQFRSHQTTIDDFIFGISHPDTHYFAIGTFCSFFLGELHEYFILKKKQKEEQNMRDSIQVGDEITTIGGIMGRVVTVKEDSIIIETGADRNKMKITRWAVSTNNTATEKAEAERQAAKEAAEAEKKKKMDEAVENSKASRKKSKKKKDDTSDS